MSTEWIQVIINSIIIVIYFLMLVSNKRMVEETKEMAKETRESRLQAYRPEIIAFIRQEDDYLYFQIKNIGTRSAHNISLEIKNFFSGTELEGGNRFFNQSYGTVRDVEKNIVFLAPGQSIESFMGISKILSQESLYECPVTIEYSNLEKLKYNDSYNLSLKDFIDINKHR